MTFPSLGRSLNSVVLSLVALYLSVSACGGSTSGSAATTSLTLASASSVTLAEEALIEFEVSTDPLAPGTYWSNRLEPPVVFTIAEGWQALNEKQGLLGITQGLANNDFVTMQIATVTGVYNGQGAVVQVASAAAASRILETNPNLLVLGTSSSLMDGREGIVVEVENSAQTGIELLRAPQGTLAIEKDHRLWMALFDYENGVLAVLVGGSATNWDEALLAAEPVLESVTIGT